MSDAGAIKVGPLIYANTNNHSTMRTPLDRKLLLLGVSVGNEILASCVEIIKSVLPVE